MNFERFQEACRAVVQAKRPQNGIGTLGEKTIHAVLKRYYEPYSDNHEIQIGGYVADIVGENGIIEIQTKQLSRLRGKLAAFLAVCPVTVVHPVIKRSRIFWCDRETGELTASKRIVGKDPRQDIFTELIAVRDFLDHPLLSFCFPILEIEEYRFLNPKQANPKKKYARCDKIPTAMLEEWELHSAADLYRFLPEALPVRFVVTEFAKAAGCALSTARAMLYLFRSVGIVRQIGKRGRSYLYELIPQKKMEGPKGGTAEN